VDRQGRYLDFINEFDVMRALEAGKDLSQRDTDSDGPLAYSWSKDTPIYSGPYASPHYS